MTTEFEGFRVDLPADDFFASETGRLVDEERASIEDAEFRRVLLEGFRFHVEESIEQRARLAMALRRHRLTRGELSMVAEIETIGQPLAHLEVLLLAYAQSLFAAVEKQASSPPPAIATLVDRLLDNLDDPEIVGGALPVLFDSNSSIADRALAHLISEPMLEENSERRVYRALLKRWPGARSYILYQLANHEHEDLPYRWFELLIESDDPEGVDRIIQEAVTHGDQADYREDLLVLLALLGRSEDPDVETRILSALNSEATPAAARSLLTKALQACRPAAPAGPWRAREAAAKLNARYLDAARLFAQGELEKCRRKFATLIKDAPEYAFLSGLEASLAMGRSSEPPQSR